MRISDSLREDAERSGDLEGCWCLFRAAIIDQLLAAIDAAPSAEAELDAATERAAEAIGCLPALIVTRLSAQPNVHGCRYTAQAVETGLMAHGPTRLAAVNALAAKAKPRVKRVEEMTVEEMCADMSKRVHWDERWGVMRNGSSEVVRIQTVNGKCLYETSSNVLPLGTVYYASALNWLRDRDGVTGDE